MKHKPRNLYRITKILIRLGYKEGQRWYLWKKGGDKAFIGGPDLNNLYLEIIKEGETLT
jgi:hypothetical protein